MVNVAVIGAGTFGTNLLNAFAQYERDSGRCHLAAFADLNEGVLQAQRQRYGIPGYLDYRDMLAREKIDAVAVATPDPFHREPVLCAAGLGKHILSEKPLDLTVEGCQAMVAAARESGVLLQVDFHKRYDPWHREMEGMLRRGELGAVSYGFMHMEDRIEVPSRWFPGWAPRSSPVWFLGIHCIDLMRWMLKSNGVRAWAVGSKGKLSSLGVDAYDAVAAQVEFACGAAVAFQTGWVLPESYEAVVSQGFRLVGEKGVINCDSQDRGTRTCTESAGMQTHNPGFLQQGTDLHGRPRYTGYGVESVFDFVDNVEAFTHGASREAIAAWGAALGEDGLEATRIAVAIHKSLMSGKLEAV